MMEPKKRPGMENSENQQAIVCRGGFAKCRWRRCPRPRTSGGGHFLSSLVSNKCDTYASTWDPMKCGDVRNALRDARQSWSAPTAHQLDCVT